MTAAHCPICLSHLPIDKFVVFPCGHGVCIDCKSNFFQESVRPNCPNCRLRIRDRDAHPLFLELVDSKVAFVLSLVEGLDRMDHETSLLNVKKAGQGLTKVVHLEDTAESSAMTTLIKAIEDFNERIIPLFTKVQVQTHQIIALQEHSLESRQETESLRDQLKMAEIKSNQLEIELNETKRNENEAVRFAKIAKDELGKVHESSLQWRKRTSELTAENKWYKDVLEKHVDPGRLQREKQKKLQKQESLKHKVAAREETTSDTARDYDGDFSAHEHSLIRLNVYPSSSSRTAIRRFHENHIGLNRQLNKSNHGARLGSIPVNMMDTDLRSAYLNPRTNPGRLTKAVQYTLIR